MVMNLMFQLHSNYYNLNNSRWESVIENSGFNLDIVKNEIVSPLLHIAF